MDDMEKKSKLNISELVKLLEKIEVEELSTTQLYELNNRIEILKEWLYRDVLYPRRIFF
jgi:hypothetical protein